MYTDVSKVQFLHDEHTSRYAPPYISSKIMTNKMVSNSFQPSMEEGYVLTAGNLQYFPMATVVPIIDMLNYLGYTRNDIRKLVADRYNSVVLAGAGGVNNGIMYWLHTLQKELDISLVGYTSFYIYDDDYWDITNVPRIHFHPLGTDPLLPKAQWVHEVLRKHKANLSVSHNNTRIPVSELRNYRSDGLPPIVVGATDIDTRKQLSMSTDCVYLQIAQSDHKLNVVINPEIEMKTRDVYGTLFLNEFHMLTLKATILLLETIKQHTEEGISTKDEKIVTSFDIQEYDRDYGMSNWLGVVPTNISYTRHNGYKEN